MGQIEFLNPKPTVIHCNVNIIHPQLRDLLQPAGEKGKVLFINKLRIDCADFTTKKVPTALCTLDFTAVCLTTGSGLVAAGGQQSELDIRPLLPLPSPSDDSGNLEAGSDSTDGTSAGSLRNSTHEQPTTSRHFPRWHLRTPTGGSINNSICIQPDMNASPSSSRSLSGYPLMGGAGPLEDDKDTCRHREKRRKELEEEMEDDQGTNFIWTRDGPIGRNMPGLEMGQFGSSPRNTGQSSSDALSDRNRIGLRVSEEERLRQMEGNARAHRGQVFRNGLVCSSASRLLGVGNSVRVLVSNNDQSVKEFRLRPPTKWRSAGGVKKIESGLPGLSRLQTVEFPTCINHSSFSPDGRHLVSVGDTPEVFLYSVNPVSGDLTKIATYTASSDASFSTSWSPDGMRFAVASQDGYVSVWDVRSACKIATLQTSQSADSRGSGAARVVKWSPRGNLLAFSEHTNYIHVVETINFTSSQKIKVPVGGTSQGRSALAAAAAASNQAMTSTTTVSSRANVLNDNSSMHGHYDMEDALHSSTDTTDAPTTMITSPSATNAAGSSSSSSAATLLLDSTSPSRFASSGRSSASTVAATNLRTWTSARRYRDIGNNVTARSPLDRALLGEWSNSRRAGVASHPEVYIDDNSTSPSDDRVAPTNSSTSMLIRTVDDIMATFEDETTNTANAAATQRGTGIWSLGELSRRIHRSENAIDISGLTWDPDGDFLYVSTEDLIAQYAVSDLRRSFGKAAMR
ncbi:hypothetical protein CBS101457_003675 [Exobasidium rhododendri]|nr:hypothetical protein CBS101457_003675 [Exobasidium rhododendri]